MLLQTKLKNQFKKLPSNNLEFHLKNIKINGSNRGCSGFIQNMDNKKIVYVNTEKSCSQFLSDKNLYRTAEHLKDYVGGTNHFANDEEIGQAIVNLLKSEVR